MKESCKIYRKERQEVSHLLRHIYSQEGLFNSINHYDENGYAGRTESSAFGGFNHYDRDGKFIGYSQEPIIGDGLEHYSAEGEYFGYTDPGILGGYVHHGEGSDGYSVDGFFGTNTYLDEE